MILIYRTIYGSPGTGKTKSLKILGSIFINVLSKCSFNKVTRSDLPADTGSDSY